MKFANNLTFKITRQYLILFALAFLILISVISSLYSSKLNAELNMVTKQKLGLIATELNNETKSIKNLHYDLIHDNEMQELMHSYNNAINDVVADNFELKDEITMKIMDKLSQKFYKYSSIRSTFMISNEKKVLNPTYSGSSDEQRLLKASEFNRFIDSQLTGRFSSANGFPINDESLSYDNKYTITYLGYYYDKYTYENLGVLAINYSKLSLLSNIEPLFSNAFDYAFVLDENNNIVLCSKNCPDSIPEEIINTNNSITITADKRSYAVFSTVLSDYNNWRLYGVIDYQNIVEPVNAIIRLSIFVSLAVIFLVFITSMRIAAHITTPLKSLGKAMLHLGKGKWITMDEPKKPDEIGNLIIGYNKMVQSLELLTDNITKEKNEKKEIEIKMLKARLDLLQTQINPHFIHNTLNTMNYMAQKENNIELSKIIIAFNALLRASMSTKNMFYTVEEEIENLKHYFNIQLNRYEIELKYNFDISEDSRLIQIPKLILQPLVENSLFHGIVPKGGGRIDINACIADNRLWMSVIDNGAGIPKDTIEQILNGTNKNARGYNSIGLSNVIDRLILAYGETSRLVIDSVEDNGTTISFSIPINLSKI